MPYYGNESYCASSLITTYNTFSYCLVKYKYFVLYTLYDRQYYKMEISYWKIFLIIFHSACLATTVAMVIVWSYEYSLNKDLCFIEYREFYQGDDDVFPVVSMCFKDPFVNDDEMRSKFDVNSSTYLQFLEGEYLDTKLLNVSYDDITFNLEDYMVQYWVNWKNETSTRLNVSNTFLKTPSASFEGFAFHKAFYKCYAIEVPPDKDIQNFAIKFYTNVFPNGIIPQQRDFFTLVHYPNQLLLSYPTVKYLWPIWKKRTDYVMRVRVTGMEVMRRRFKHESPCVRDGSNYDDRILKGHSKAIGCRAPYQKRFNDDDIVPPCTTKDKINEAKVYLKERMPGQHNNSNSLPCKTMEKVFYTYEESQSPSTQGNETFWFQITLLDHRFKQITQHRYVVFDSIPIHRLPILQSDKSLFGVLISW